MTDTGSKVTTCHNRRFVHDFNPISFDTFLNAGDTVVDHWVVGSGYLCVSKGDVITLMHPMWFTHSLRETVLWIISQ